MNDQEFLASLNYVHHHQFITSSKLIIFYIVLIYYYIRSLLFRLLHLFLFHMRVFLSNQLIAFFLSSFELKAILLIYSIKTLCVSLLNLYYVFNINLLFFYEFFMISLILSMSVLFFSR